MNERFVTVIMEREEALRQRLLPFRDGNPIRKPLPPDETGASHWSISSQKRDDDTWENFVASAGVWWSRYTDVGGNASAGMNSVVFGLRYIDYLTGRDDEIEPGYQMTEEEMMRIASTILGRFERVLRAVDTKERWRTPIRFNSEFQLYEKPVEPGLWRVLFGPPPPQRVVLPYGRAS